MILLGWMALTVAFGWRMETRRPVLAGPWAWRFAVALLLLVIAGSAGAVAALGNTLFPADTLVRGMRMDFDPASNILVRLRVLHPIAAALAAAWLFYLSITFSSDDRAKVRVWATLLGALVLAQVLAGIVNLMLLAPVWMQLSHLLLADGVWMATVLLGALVLTRND